MQVRVLYFAVVRERVGRAEEALRLADGADVAALAAAIEERHPALRGVLCRVRFAVNERFAEPDATLGDGDVVAVIPPVAGGAPRPARERVALLDAPLSHDAVAALVHHPGAGALATFVGWVREHNEGRAVELLEYTAYRAMAVAEMTRLVEELEAAHPQVRLAVHHRLGALRVGDTAVICAASAPHRDAAFVAGRALIDGVKARAPIWKRERGPNGAVWIGAEALDAEELGAEDLGAGVLAAEKRASPDLGGEAAAPDAAERGEA